MNNNELQDEVLEKVNDGSIDWKLFSTKYLNYLSSSSLIEITPEHKNLAEAVKKKDYAEVAVIAIKVIAIDPAVAQIAYECRQSIIG